MATELEDGLEVEVTVTSGADAEGNPKPIDANVPVTGVSSDESIATVGPAFNADGSPNNAAVLVVSTPGGNLGNVDINITGDADTSEGSKPVSVVHAFTVVAGDTVSLTTEAGTPRPRGSGPTPTP